MMHGVKFILLVHFAVNIALIMEAVGLIFFPEGNWMGSKSMGFEVLVSGYCLAGLAIIAGAFYGVVIRSEVYIRVYLFYMMLTILIDAYYLVKVFILSGPCEGLPAAFKEVGQSFVCGVARATDGAIVTGALGLQMYLFYVVWSFAEDMATCGLSDFSDLLVDEDVFVKRRKLQDAYSSMVGSYEYVPYEYGSIYDTAVDGGMGGSTRIFNGRRHEMEYPPPRGLMKVR